MAQRVSNVTTSFSFQNADCFEALKKLPDHSVDLVITDPPFNITRNSWDVDITGVLDVFWAELRRVCTPNANVLIFGVGLFAAKVMLSNPDWYRYKIVWEKAKATGWLNVKHAPMKSFEEILKFSAKGWSTYNPQYGQGEPYSRSALVCNSSNYGACKANCASSPDGKRYPRDVIRGFNAKQKGHIHPTQKPVELLEYLVKTYSNEGDTVLDPFAGSCSCGRACLNTNRSFIGFELNKEYFLAAKQAIEADYPTL